MHRPAILSLLLFICTTPAIAQTSYPMITHVTPVAVQRGKTTDVTVEGQMDFAGVNRVLFEGTGASAEVVEQAKKPEEAKKSATAKKSKGAPPGTRNVRLRVTVAADAPTGVREFRVAGPLGASSAGQLVIVEYPVVSESGDNGSLAKANPVPVPCVVAGRIEAAEDVDFFRFHAEAGRTLTFEILCARLQDKVHDLQNHADPMLTLFDLDGRELAANDDFNFADPLLTYKFAKAGDYAIQVRDAKYEGDPRWAYALTITDRPTATHVFPMAGNPGTTVEVEPVGPARSVRPRVALQVPTRPGLHTIPLDLGGVTTNPVPFLVSSLPQVLEQEPNDTPEQATRVTLPCGINGRIGVPRDVDHFVFRAAKGKSLRFEVKARRFGTPLTSSLDSVLDVLSPKGNVLASNDDAFGKDSALVFAPPADGDYVLRIRDLNGKGGPTAVYHIEADFARPDFTLHCDPDKANVAPGCSAAWYVLVNRTNGFAGPVRVTVEGLPKGITATPLTIPASMTQGLIVLSAAADAAPAFSAVRVVGTATACFEGKEETLTRTAVPYEEIYSPGGGRARFEVALQTVAVTDPGDVLKVEVSPQQVLLKPGGTATLDVKVTRRPGFDQGLSLDVLLRHLGSVYGNPLPPGVTIDAAASKTLLGGASAGKIVLKAAANAAPIDDVPISVLAHVSINFVVKVSYSSPVIRLSVRK
jgi:hypothetical protein